jgi:hypothetical protein
MNPPASGDRSIAILELIYLYDTVFGSRLHRVTEQFAGNEARFNFQVRPVSFIDRDGAYRYIFP